MILSDTVTVWKKKKDEIFKLFSQKRKVNEGLIIELFEEAIRLAFLIGNHTQILILFLFSPPSGIPGTKNALRRTSC